MAYELATAYVQIMPTTKGIGDALESEMGSAGKEAGDKAGSSFSKGFGNALKTVGKAAGAALVGAGTAITAFTKNSVQAGMEFDSAMSQVQATMLKTAEEMESEVGTAMLTTSDGVKEFSGNLREFAQFMGANTAFSATQAAEALNYMALAGYDTQDSMDMLPNVLNLASAGAMDLAKASDMVTDTQTAFGLKIEEMPQLVDEMAKAASTGNTSVEQLGEAFLTVGGLAQELNGGFVTLADGTTAPTTGIQEMEIALTAMANAGIKGSEAGTHMRNMLLKLASPTSDGVKQLEKLGVAVFGAEGNMRSLQDIMGDLSGALGELTQEQKIQAISDLFNTRDLASAEALLNAVGEDWDKIGASILDSEGAAADMAGIQLDNLNGDITLLQSAFEGLQIAISDGATPFIREAVQGLTGVVDGVHDLVSGVEGADQKIADGFSSIVSGVTDGLPVLLEVFSSIMDGLGDVFPELLKTITDQTPKLFKNIVGIISKQMPKLAKDVLPSAIDACLSMIAELAANASDIIMPIIHSLPDIVGSVMDGLIDNMPAIVSGLVRLAGQIVAELPVILGQITIGIVKNLPSLFTGILDGVIDGVKGVFGDVSEWMASEGAQELNSAAKELAGSLDAIAESTANASKESAYLAFAGQEELSYYERLINRLDEVVDENGHIRDGNEDLAQQLIGELNEAMGIEMEAQDGVIQNWQKERQEITQLMELKRMQMQLDIEQEQAARAAEAEAELYETLRAANQDLVSVQQQRADAQRELDAIMADGRVSILEAKRATELKSTLELLKTTEQDLQATIGQSTVDYQAAIATQETYLSDYTAFTEGRYEDVTGSFTEFIFKVKSGTGEYGTALQEAISDTELHLSTLISQYKASGDEIYLADIETSMRQLETLRNNNAEYRSTLQEGLEGAAEDTRTLAPYINDGLADGILGNMNEAQDAIEQDMEALIDEAKSILEIGSPSKVFREIGSFSIEGLTEGIESEQASAISQIASVMAAVVSAASDYSYISQMYNIGMSLGDGIADGLESRSSYISNIAANAVSSAVSAAKAAGDIHSPSRIMRKEVGQMLSAGLALGIEDGEENIIDTIETVNDDMMNAYSLTADIAPQYINGNMAAAGSIENAGLEYWNRMVELIGAEKPGSGSDSSGSGSVTINVYAAEGQDPREIARAVMKEITKETRKGVAAYA